MNTMPYNSGVGTFIANFPEDLLKLAPTHTFVTPNDRLAREHRRAWDVINQGRGALPWKPLDSLSITRFFVREFHHAVDAGAVCARYLQGADTEHVLELGEVGRRRVFNLGYYTWVEQQGVSVDVFDARRTQSWWDALRPYTARWDEMIDAFNARTGVSIN